MIIRRCVAILCLLSVLPYTLALQELTDDTFASFISQSGKFCIMFYSPSCGTCQAALPVFKSVSQLIEEDKTVNITLAQIDVSEYTASGDRYDVWLYPTMVIDGGDFPYQQVYKGSPTSREELTKWIKEFGSPSHVPPTSALWVLNDASFTDCTEERICMVQFTDSRCIHCLARGNHIHELANHVNKHLHGEGVRVAQVDLAKHPDIGKKYNIELRGAASNRVFINGEMYDYNGPDDWESAATFIKARIESPLRDITTMSEYASDFLSGKKSCAVALLMPNSENFTGIQNHYLSWAESTRDFCSHYLITDRVMLEEMEIDHPKFVIKHSAKTLTPSEPPHFEIEVPTGAGETWFAEQFKKKQFSLVNEISRERIASQLRDLDHFVGIFVENPSWGEEMNTLKKAIAGIAIKFQDQGLPFFIGNVADFSVDFEEVDTINANVPFLLMIRDKNDRQYTPYFKTLQKFKNKPEKLYYAFVASYVSQYLKGEIAPRIKSDLDHGVYDGVLDIVGVSVDRVLRRTDKDILMLMTSSNRCRSCPRYEDALMTFGEKYENPETLTVGMINVETNQLPRKLVMKSSPPHMVLLPAERNGPFESLVYFYDEISEDNLKKFVTEHGKHNLMEKKNQNRSEKKDHQEKQKPSAQEDATTEEDPEGTFQSIHASVIEESPSDKVREDKKPEDAELDKKLADVQWEKKSEDIKEDPEYIKLKQKMEEMFNERLGGMNMNSMYANNINPMDHKYDEKYEMEYELDPEDLEYHSAGDSSSTAHSNSGDRSPNDHSSTGDSSSTYHDEL